MTRRRVFIASLVLALIALCCSTASPDATRMNRFINAMEVWGNVQRPVVLKQVLPKYPTNIRDRVSGIVIVEVWIRADGSVADVRPLKPMPFGMTEAAVEAVRKWRFTPGRLNGTPVPVIQNVTVNFAL